MTHHKESKSISLGLQGGGTHGAFTWGVIDRFLEEKDLTISGVSGTSAGAMNAVVLIAGLAKGGRDKARQDLHDFWKKVSREGDASPMHRTMFDRMMGNWTLARNPAVIALTMTSSFMSPYDFNPLNLNPLKDIVDDFVDFDAVQSSDIKLFLSATNVKTGRMRVFTNKEITAQTVMASSCLPQLFQAVEIDGVPYWDGGYTGNPPLFPLYEHVPNSDIVVVQITPIRRETTPRHIIHIQDRICEITFNGQLMDELRALEQATHLLEQGVVNRWSPNVSNFRPIHLHRVHADKFLAELDPTTQMSAEWDFLNHLRDMGRKTANVFLEEHYDNIGVRSTLDLDEILAD